MEDNKELEGLGYENLELDKNVHKIVGRFNKHQEGQVGEVEVEPEAMWLVTGLGYLSDKTPDDILKESLEDVVIVSKKELIEFIKSER